MAETFYTVTDPSIVLSDLIPGRDYEVSVRAINDVGSSAFSTPVPFTVPEAPTATPFMYAATGATNSTVRSTVNPSGGSNTQTTDLTNINNAITSASNAGGGVVQLSAGQFWINGRIIMRAGVRLQGATRAADNTTVPTTIIKNGPNAWNSTTNGGYSMLTGGAANWTVKDILFDGSESLAPALADGPRLSAYLVESRGGSNVVFDGVFTKATYTYNIVFADTIVGGIRNCNILVDTVGRWNQLDGIHIFNSDQYDVVDNHVDNGFSGTTGDGDDGLVSRSAFGGVNTNGNYENNWVRGGRHGSCIQLAVTDDPITGMRIVGNTFIGTSNFMGVFMGFYGGTNGTLNNILVDGNHFEDCTEACVDFRNGTHTNVTVTDNTSVRSAGYFVDSGGGNVVSNNT